MRKCKWLGYATQWKDWCSSQPFLNIPGWVINLKSLSLFLSSNAGMLFSAFLSKIKPWVVCVIMRLRRTCMCLRHIFIGLHFLFFCDWDQANVNWQLRAYASNNESCGEDETHHCTVLCGGCARQLFTVHTPSSTGRSSHLELNVMEFHRHVPTSRLDKMHVCWLFFCFLKAKQASVQYPHPSEWKSLSV